MQILSWRPRVVYFPNFTSAEACQHIIEMAKPKLEPSKLALREGETAESTKGTRTRCCHEPGLYCNILPMVIDNTPIMQFSDLAQ